MTDRAVVAMAAAAGLGAWWGHPFPLALGPAVAVLALVARRPALLVLAALLVTSTLAERSWQGLEPPAPRAVAAEVELVSDPVPVAGAVRVEVRVGRRRVLAQARGAEAAALRERLAGERVWIEGWLRPLDERSRIWLARRHVSGRLAVVAVGAHHGGAPPARAANAVRRTLHAGTASLAPGHRSLFGGFVLGDRRGQPDVVEDDFRGSGLTHLLVVSGKNVALLLVLVRPVLARLALRPRLVVTIGLIGFFGLVTRFEPSVLRASVMAAIAVTSSSLGRPAPSLRTLGLAVTAILIVDPLLVGHLAFALSVAASAGIVVLAGPIAARLSMLPRPVADAVGVTVAAQIGVAPVLVPVFEGLPVASVPANVLAAPAAGLVKAWGMSAGLAAGVAGEPLATAVHLPTRVLTEWIARVAAWGSALPLGVVRPGHLVAGAAAALVALAARRWRRPVATAAGVAGLSAALLAAALVPPRDAVWGEEIAHGARLWRAGGGVVLVLDGADAGRVLDRLRVRGVRRVDLVVSVRGTRTAGGALHTLRQRVAVDVVLAPPGHRVRDAVVPTAGSVLVVGSLRVQVGTDGRTLAVDVGDAGGPRPVVGAGAGDPGGDV